MEWSREERRREEAAEAIRSREILRLLGRVNLSPRDRRIVERFSRSLVSGLFRGPVSRVEHLFQERRGRAG